MEFPLESAVSTAIEKIADGVIAKMNANEEKRNREFTYQLKELEFYKRNYEKDLKDIFDYWFDVVRVAHIKDNENISENDRQKYHKQFNDLLSVNKVARYKMNTLKYGGTETGRILALESGINQKKFEDKPEMTALFVWCTILAVLKKDILGQDLDPIDIIRVLVYDFEDNKSKIIDAKKYAVKLYKDTYGKVPFWNY